MLFLFRLFILALVAYAIYPLAITSEKIAPGGGVAVALAFLFTAVPYLRNKA